MLARGVSRVDQHVDTCDVPVAKPKLLGCLGDLFELLPVNRNVDIFGRPSTSGPAHGDLEENRKPAHDAILNASRIKCGMKPFDPLEKLVHVSIVGAGGDHSQFYLCMTWLDARDCASI